MKKVFVVCSLIVLLFATTVVYGQSIEDPNPVPYNDAWVIVDEGSNPWVINPEPTDVPDDDGEIVPPAPTGEPRTCPPPMRTIGSESIIPICK